MKLQLSKLKLFKIEKVKCYKIKRIILYNLKKADCTLKKMYSYEYTLIFHDDFRSIFSLIFFFSVAQKFPLHHYGECFLLNNN